MKKKSVAVAYPTIPIIFLGGINPDRTPLYDTMGLAVTSSDEETRTETTVEVSKSANDIDVKFSINGKKISGLRGQQIIKAIRSFLSQNNISANITIKSNNYRMFSGSSDSGLAAVFTALNDVFELNFTKTDLLKHSMKGSESAGRSLYGGLTLTKASTKPPTVAQLASEKDLEKIRLFSVPFYYKSRISADEIHSGIVTNPNFQERVNKIPEWVDKILTSLKNKDYISLLKVAEENIRNAHELLEEVNLPVRKQEMMYLCEDVEKMRERKLEAYFLIGGGNLVTIATLDEYAEEIAKFLSSKNWEFYNFKVASAPKIIKSII
ncbi:MAG: hypothetical protein HZR80_05290 [Candidatus Heimdallarchaeota archaeon]